MRYWFIVCPLLVLGILVACDNRRESSGDGNSKVSGETKMDASLPTTPTTDAEWRQKLTPEEYRVLRQKGTEAPFIGKYTDTTEAGTYYCAACGQELFKSDTKFPSECGWPAFYAAAAGDRVKLIPDRSFGMVRTEVECARCGSHLGHIFDDAPDQPTGQRYCINSISLKFVPAKSVTATAPTTAPTILPGASLK